MIQVGDTITIVSTLLQAELEKCEKNNTLFLAKESA